MMRDAISGFGRIGRLVARAILERPESGRELVSINDLPETCANAWLFKQDSFHGAHSGEVMADCASGTMDTLETAVIDEKLVRGPRWCDDGWGFSNCMVDKAATMARRA